MEQIKTVQPEPGLDFGNMPLGRVESPDRKHEELYPFSAVAPLTVATVERVLQLPPWHRTWNQHSEGKCVGMGACMERTITNTEQAFLQQIADNMNVRYDPDWVWNESKKIDPWAHTNPGDNEGTSVRSAYDILRNLGPKRVLQDGSLGAPTPADGVETTRWALNVDEIRTAIAMGKAVTIGVNWYRNFDKPQRPWKDSPDKKERKEYWIATVGEAGWEGMRGGHAVCIFGASDRRQAFCFKNSWGANYPETWLPYYAMEILLKQGGDAAIVTDR